MKQFQDFAGYSLCFSVQSLCPSMLPLFLFFLSSYLCYYYEHFFKVVSMQGAWVAQLLEHWTLGFSLHHDLRVVGLSPASHSMLSTEFA